MDPLPPSPPSSTCLPAHFAFPPLTGLDPPPTDGPNTRDRLSRGLLPKSGRTTLPQDDFALDGTHPDSRGSFTQGAEWTETWPGTGLYSSGADYDVDYSFSSSVSSTSIVADSYLDPTLRPSTASTTAATAGFDHLPPPEYPYDFRTNSMNDDDLFSFYPPPLPVPPETSTSTEHLALSSSASFPNKRIVSNATIVEHDSSFDQSSDGGELNKSTTSNGLGITKEEWLRLGGFAGDGAQACLGDASFLSSSEGNNEGVKLLNSNGETRASYQDSTLIFAPPPPLFPPFPTPAPAAQKISTFVLPSPGPPPFYPPTPIESSYDPSPLGLPPPANSMMALPTPPPHLYRQDKDPLSSTWSTSNPEQHASTGPLPSKLPRKRRTPNRPTPYPLPPHSSSDDLAVSSPLSPMSTSLLSLGRFPVPPSLPPRGPPNPANSTVSPVADSNAPNPKKSHARKASVGHVPRPRNAFILFRCHIVNSGLIPKTMLVPTTSSPRAPGTRTTGAMEEKAVDHKNVSRLVGHIWRGLSDEDRHEWDKLAEREKQEHKELYPEYRYKPKTKPKAKGKGATSTTRPRSSAKAQTDKSSLERLDEEDEHPNDISVLSRSDEEPDDIVIVQDSSLPTMSVDSSSRPESSPWSTPTKPSRARTAASATIARPAPKPSFDVSSPNSESSSNPHPTSAPSSSPETPRHSRSRSMTTTTTTTRNAHDLPYSRLPAPPPTRRRPVHARPSSRPSSLSNLAAASHGRSDLGYSNDHVSPQQTVVPIPTTTTTTTTTTNVTQSQSRNLDKIPLFEGPTSSRQFSLGRWELRIPERAHDKSPPPPCLTGLGMGGTSTGTRGLMDRSLVASRDDEAQGRRRDEEEEEEEEGEGEERGEGGGGPKQQAKKRVPSALLAFEPSRFLTESGLAGFDDSDGVLPSSPVRRTSSTKLVDDDDDTMSNSAIGDDAESTSTWSFSTAPTTLSGSTWSTLSSSTSESLLRERQAPVIGARGGVRQGAFELPFHFGTTDLFSKPPQALAGHRTISNASPLSASIGSGGGGGTIGLGIEWGTGFDEGGAGGGQDGVAKF